MELGLGDVVQVYHPRAQGRIGVIVGIMKDKVRVLIRGMRPIVVDKNKVLLVKRRAKASTLVPDNPGEIHWIRKSEIA